MSEKSTRPTLSVDIKPDEVETYRQSLAPTTTSQVLPIIVVIIAVLAAGATVLALAF